MAAGDGVSKTIGRLLLVRSGLSKLIGRLWQSIGATGDDKRSTDPAVFTDGAVAVGNVCRPCVTTGGGGSGRCVLTAVASVALNAAADEENTVLEAFSAPVLLKAVPFLDTTLLLNGTAQLYTRVTASLAGASVANRISRISDVLIGSPLPCDVHASGALMMLTLGVDVDAKVLSTDAPAIGGLQPDLQLFLRRCSFSLPGI